MYARGISILLGIAAIVILIEWRMPRPRLALQPDKPVVLPDEAELDRMIADADFNKTPLSVALRTLAQITRTNIVTTADAPDSTHWQTSPISIHFQNVSLATALFVICDLVSDPTGDVPNTDIIRYGVNDAGIIVVGNTSTDSVYDLPAQLDVSDIGDLLAIDRSDTEGDDPRQEPMRFFDGYKNPPLFEFLCGDASASAGVFFGKRLVLYETPHQKRATRRFVEAIRHPIDLEKPSTLPTYPVRRLARFHLENIPAKEAFEQWRIAAGANAGYELPRPKGYDGERFEYDYVTPITVDLSDVSVEDAVAPIIEQCGRGLSVYHEQNVVYVRPDSGRPPGQWCVFDITEFIAHPERWQGEDYAFSHEQNLEFLRTQANDDRDRTRIWHNRLAVFATPADLAAGAERLRKLLLQKSPPPPQTP